MQSNVKAIVNALETIFSEEEQPESYLYLNPLSKLGINIGDFEEWEYAHLTKKEREANIQPIRNSAKNPKISRNYPCPCGSGKKYKKCCGK